MKNTKRIIAAVLTVIMMISMLPSNALATETTGNDAAESAVEAVSVTGEEQEVESTVEDVSGETAEKVQEVSEDVQTVENAEPAAAEETEQIAEISAEETVLYPEKDFEGKAGLVTVKVHAPEGALPEGTELKVEEVKKAKVEELVNEATEAVKDYVAVDISFHVNGQEEDFAPLKEVKVEFVLEKDALPQAESYDVIHVAVDEEGKETPEVIEDEKIIDEITAEGGQISQKDFSVFIIAATGEGDDEEMDTKAVATYKFFTDDTFLTPYENGDYDQKVKNGESLQLPKEPAEVDHKIFDGWYLEDGTELVFGEVLSGLVTGEYKVYPKYVDAYYAVFYDFDKATVVETIAGKSGDEIAVSDIVVEPTTTTNVFVGWTTNQNWTADSYTLVGDKYTFTDKDEYFYPIFVEGWVVSFDLCDDQVFYTDPADESTAYTVEASYVAPQYVAPNKTAEEPDAPIRDGYTFGGWYTDDSYTTAYDFTTPVTKDTVLYAKWENGTADVRVIIWRQKSSDKVDTPYQDHTYDYYTEYTVKANTGDIITNAAGTDAETHDAYNYRALADAQEPASEYTGFKFDSDNTFNQKNASVTVNPAGTVINVYYDRKVVTYSFDTDEEIYIYVGPEYEGDEQTYSYNEDEWPSGYYRGNKGPKAVTDTTDYWVRDDGVKVKYGWDQALPPASWFGHAAEIKDNCYAHCNIIRWHLIGGRSAYTYALTGYASVLAHYYYYRNQSGYYEDDDGEYIKLDGHTIEGLYGSTFEEQGFSWPSGEWYYQNADGGKTNMSVLATFLPQFDAPDPYNVLFKSDVNTSDTTQRYVYFYLQNTDGRFLLANQGLLSGSSVTFNFSQKYATHQLYAFKKGQMELYEDDDAEPGAGSDSFSLDQIDGIEYFTYSGETFSPASTTVSDERDDQGNVSPAELHIFFSRKTFTVTYSNNVFADGTTNTASFGYLDAMTAPAEADINYPEEAERAYYTFDGWYEDPEFKTSVTFGEGDYAKMPAHNLIVYAKWKKTSYKVTLDANGGTIDGAETKEIAVANDGVTPTFNAAEYVPTRDNYTFLGWVKNSVSGSPFTSETLTGDITLFAKWRYNGTLHVRYMNGETDLGLDSKAYRENSHAKAAAKPANITSADPSTPLFIGWKDKNDNIYRAGEIFDVNSEMANEDGVVVLTAFFGKFEKYYTTVIFHDNADEDLQIAYNGKTATNELTVTIESDAPALGVNDSINLAEVSLERQKYKLAGWAKDADADEPEYFTSDIIGADNEEPIPNDLYAVWDVKKFTIYHSGTGVSEEILAVAEDAEDVTFDFAAGSTFNIVGRTDDDYLYGGYYAYSETEDGDPVKGEAYTVSGFRMTPEDGETYYLKEVSTEYLKPQIYIIHYAMYGGKISDMYGFVNVDNKDDYRSCGTLVNDEERKADLFDKITVTKEGKEGEQPKVEELTPVTVFGSTFANAETYPCVMGMVDNLSDTIKANTTIDLRAYYVTQDYVRVTGEKKRRVAFRDACYHGGWGLDGGIKTGYISNDKTVLDVTPAGLFAPRPAAGMKSMGVKAVRATAPKMEYVIHKVYDSGSEEQTVGKGDHTGEITYQEKAGYMFAGWYLDDGFVNAADFTDVAADMTVYAKYVSLSDIAVTFTRVKNKTGDVTFNAAAAIKNTKQFKNVNISCVKGTNTFSADLSKSSTIKRGSTYTYKFNNNIVLKGMTASCAFTAEISWVTPDGTSVTGKTYSCKYRNGVVTVK